MSKPTTITFQDGETRDYHIKTELTPELVGFVAEQFLENDMETPAQTGRAFVQKLLTDRDYCNTFMQAALAGDHDGVDWYRDITLTQLVDIATEFLTGITPSISAARRTTEQAYSTASEIASGARTHGS